MSTLVRPLSEASRRVDIYFRRNGRVDIMASVVKALGIVDGDVVNVLSSSSGEYYFYVAHRAVDRSSNSRYRNAVHCVTSSRRKGVQRNNMRFNNIELTRRINSVTGSAESWLFVGQPRDLSSFGVSAIGLPLIYSNNQFKES